jgi:aspartyl-tRNA(Asn)/glutamyl-tRNA(Gln) amidotransferase subunit A
VSHPLSVSRAREEIAAGHLAPAELVEAVLRRIEARDPDLNAYLHVDGDAALAAARAAPPGPLRGIPLCVKDVIDVVGMPTTAGTSAWRRRPAADAPAVARLRAAGAVVIGKGHTNELAYGIDGRNPHHGDCRNPRDPERIAGGSSSGPTAAVAAGLALGGLGTDTTGSLRVPPSLCGTVGLRTSLGLVPRAGVLPLSWSYDTVGPVARSVADCGLLLEALAGRPLARGAAHRLDGLRIGLLEELCGERCEPYVQAALESAAAAFRELGAAVVPVSLPLLRRAGAIHNPIQLAEAAAVHAERFPELLARCAPDVRARLLAGSRLAATTVLTAARARRVLVDELHSTLDRERLDALLAPTTPAVAPRRDAETLEVRGRAVPLRAALTSLVLPLSQPPGPTLALPLGEHQGLPFGMQLHARPGAEPALLRLGGAYEAATRPASAG